MLSTLFSSPFLMVWSMRTTCRYAISGVPCEVVRRGTNILPDDAAGANVQVAHFAVAHEAFGQAYGERRSLKLSEALSRLGAFLCKLVHVRRLCGEDGIALLGRLVGGNAPPVNDDCGREECQLEIHRGTRLCALLTQHGLVFCLGHRWRLCWWRERGVCFNGDE